VPLYLVRWEVNPFGCTRCGNQRRSEVRRYYSSFSYRAGSWSKPRRVVAKVEWHPGELYPRVGFIVTNLARPAEGAYSYPLTTRRLSISSPVPGSCGRSVTRVAAGLWSPSGPVFVGEELRCRCHRTLLPFTPIGQSVLGHIC
jgi:hypothetical protein